MSEDFNNVTREEQFVEVVASVGVDIQVLEKKKKKIVKSLSTSMIASVYSEADSDDMLFIEIASKKLIDQFKEEARVGSSRSVGCRRRS